MVFLELWGRLLHRPDLVPDGEDFESRWRGYFLDLIRSGRRAAPSARGSVPRRRPTGSSMVDGLGLKAVLGLPAMTPAKMRAILLRFAAEQLGVPTRTSTGGRAAGSVSVPVPELVTARSEGPLCILTLDRPDKLNALSTAVERELGDALRSDEVRESRCIVLTGAGRAFSAGADLTEISRDDPAAIAAYYQATGDVYERFAALPQPTIAAIHGYCLGGGFELALAADFRVAEETAVFGLPEVALGIVPSSGGLHRLVRIVGPARAKEAMLLRKRLDAREAYALGLVTEVVAEGAALERAQELAEGLASLPPLAVAVAKQAADLLAESSREAGVAIERLAYGMLAQTEEARAAAEDFGRRKG